MDMIVNSCWFWLWGFGGRDEKSACFVRFGDWDRASVGGLRIRRAREDIELA